MKKVLATLLIATVSLTTLLANGISEGTLRDGTIAPTVEIVAGDESLDVNEESVVNETTTYANGRGAQSPRSNVGNRVNQSQSTSRQQGNNSSNLQRHNPGEMVSRGNSVASSNQANENMRNSTGRVENNYQRMNQEDCLVDDCSQVENRFNNQNLEGRSARVSNKNQQQMNAQGNVGNKSSRNTNALANNQGTRSSNQLNQGVRRANDSDDMARAGSQSQRFDDCTNLDGTTPRESPRYQINEQDIDD